MNRKLAIGIAAAVSVSALALIALVLVNRSVPLQSLPTSPSGPSEPPPVAGSGEAVLSESEMGAVSLVLQEQMGLDGAVLSERGDVLELRFEAQALSASDTVVLLAGLFDWLDRAVPEGSVDHVRIVLTASGVDGGYAQASRADIQNWRSGSLSSESFVSGWERVSLVATE